MMLSFNSIVYKRCFLIAEECCIGPIEDQQLLMRAPFHDKEVGQVINEDAPSTSR